MENTKTSLHPMLLVAAGSVTLASLAAAAHFTGLIPGRTAEPAPLAVAAAPQVAPTQVAAPVAAQPAPAPQVVVVQQPAAPAAAAPVARPKPQPRQAEPAVQARSTPRYEDEDWRYQSGTRRVSSQNGIDVIPSRPQPVAAPEVPPAPPVCRDCGTVENVREVATQAEGSGLGAIAGGVLGGVLGNQVGNGKGRDLATIAAAVGGAYAGHQVEKNVRGSKQYQVSVRFDDGSVRTYTQGNPDWRIGDRVRLSNGSLLPI